MALPTFKSARDEIFGLFYTAWSAQTPALNGGQAVRVEWQGVDSGNPPQIGQPYVRAFVQHADSGQSTFGDIGQRRFTRNGIVSILIFVPIADGAGISIAGQLAVIARDAFEGVGTTTGLWFRDTKIKEVGRSEEWFQINVTSIFEYDEAK